MDKFAAAAPAEALRVMEEELAKLAGLEQASSEFNVTRNYLDWLTQLPWGQQSVERLDVDHAQTARAQGRVGVQGFLKGLRLSAPAAALSRRSQHLGV